MSTTTFKELCLDTTCTDGVVGRFWAALTGCTFQQGAAVQGAAVQGGAEGDPGDVVGDEEGMGIAICPVPEEKTVKNRVHLDVSVASLEDVTALGGTIGEAHEHWTVCHDPEGNEFCAFVREDPLPSYRVFEFNVDCVDPEPIARWWADRFGVEARNTDRLGNVTDWWWLAGAPGFPASGPFFAMVFGPVPEPKTVKNRMHWDVYGDPGELIAAGASKLWEVPGRTRPIAWTVLADPEGNEFCVFPPSAPL
ncbi:MAG TPA: VOC family protein [Marmoricola sp.]